jgi:hypothetical protein
MRRWGQVFQCLRRLPNAEGPPLFDGTLAPSPSLLFYLFAARVLPPARRGLQTPGAGGKVDTKQLATALLAVAFWHLRTSGLVHLEPAVDGLKVTRTAGAKDAHRDGIEAGLLDVLTPGVLLSQKTPAWEASGRWTRAAVGFAHLARTHLATRSDVPEEFRGAAQAPAEELPETVTATITRWFGYHVCNPSAVPIQWAEREGLAKGYLAVVDAQRHPVARFFLGKTIQVPQYQRIATLEPTFAALLRRWQAFRTREAALSEQLEQAVAAGLAAVYDEAD